MGTIWELDFYSRPIVDDSNKKLWEVVICESLSDSQAELASAFQYAQFCTSAQVNSVWLQEAIQQAIDQAPSRPDRIRFFRRQMNNMIVRACEGLNLDPKPSRRISTLRQVLNQRSQEVYPTMVGFQATQVDPIASSVSYQASPPQPLPDALQGQKWAFVTLEASAFADMPDWSIDFGEAFPLSMFKLMPETPVPGLIIFSPRAVPLAAWLSGVELAFLKYSPTSPASLVLETGADDRWVLANVVDRQTQQEAAEFEIAKQNANQVHFLAVQSDPNAQAFAGFWLLQEVDLA